MDLKEKNGIKYTSFDIFDSIDFINCKVSTKLGGVSKEFYESMNLSFSIGDREDLVYQNYRLFANNLGFTYENIQRGYQTHGKNISIVRNDFEEFSKTPQFKDTDILITSETNVPIVTLFADCVPIFLVDKKNKTIAVVHSGWRGTLEKAVKVAIEKMNELHSIDKDDLLVGIGPSIHECCFLVDDDVFNEFNRYSEYKKYIKKIDKKYSIDLQSINKQSIIETGLVLEKNIEISKYCTCCNTDIFFSHRKQNVKRGSMAGFLEIIN